MKLIVSLFNQLQKLVFDLSRVIMKGYIFIINKTSSGVSETGINDVWMMLRDICNMFFILVLLIIGISTILGIKKYSYKKNLVNVLISAFLINYSKVIVGMLIDFSQIFIIPFNDAISGNISLITDAAFFIDVGEKNISAAILGFIFALGFFAVSIIALVYALIRLVFIWITIAISPIIVLGYGVPFDKVKTSLKGFFKKFVSFLTGGILLSFFMWFALYILSASSSSISNSINNETSLATSTIISAEEGVNDIKGSNLILMIVSLAFLIYAQKFAISSSKQAGSFAGDIVSKASSIGMKPLKGLQNLGIKSSNLGKKALGGVANIGKDYTSGAFSNIKGVGLSSLKNRSSRFDNFMTKRDERISMGNKEFRAQQVNKTFFGGKDLNISLRKETVDSLNQKKAMALSGLQSSGASVSEIKLTKYNWDLKTKEKEMEIAREALKTAPSGDARDKAQQELNSKRDEHAKLKGDKNKYIKELKNIQLGKSSISEDSTQLKGVKEIIDNLGDGSKLESIKEDHKNLFDNEDKLKRLNPYERDLIMAELLTKIKNKKLGAEDIKFIEDNQAMLRGVSQDILVKMNSEIDKNYENNEKVQKLKQKIKDPDIFDLGDKENADIKKGEEYQKYKDLIDETFSEVKNIKTEEERDEKLKELDEKDAKDDLKKLFKYQADLIIKELNLKNKKETISGMKQKLESFVGTSDSDDEFERGELEKIAILEKEYKDEKNIYEELKTKSSNYKKVKDLDVGVLKSNTKKEDNKKEPRKESKKESEEKFHEKFANNFTREMSEEGDNNKSNSQSGSSSNQSESQEKSEQSDSNGNSKNNRGNKGF